MFATTKHQLVFMNKTDFDKKSITAVVGNCATAIVLNDETLFVGELTPTQDFILITVGSSDCKPTHYGPAEMSVHDDDGQIITMSTSKAMCLPTSPVNVVSIGDLSLSFVNGSCDEETHMKSTHDKSWFSWDHGKYHSTIIHPPNGLTELMINEQELERLSCQCLHV